MRECAARQRAEGCDVKETVVRPVRPEAAPLLADRPQVVGISPLLRELIQVAMTVPTPYAAESRDGRLMRLLLDELHALPVLPMHLPNPTDARLKRICAHIDRHPDDASTLDDWAQRLGVNVKTLQRLFVRDTGMTLAAGASRRGCCRRCSNWRRARR